MKIAYWITTILVAIAFILAGVAHLSHAARMKQGIASLGYPEYFLTIDGAANFLAVLALLIPGFPTLREWAYAGLTFLLIGAIWSHTYNHQNPLAPLVLLILVIASYVLWRRLWAHSSASLTT